MHTKCSKLTTIELTLVFVVVVLLQLAPNSTESLGVVVLKSRGIFPEARWYWIGVAATIGYILLFNFLFTIALKYLDRK